MKKLVSLLMAAVVALTALSVGAFAADTKLAVSCKLNDGYTIVTVQKSGTVYYTTDGSKPTKKSRKLSASKLRFNEPCTLRLVSYVKGKPTEYLKKKISVRLEKPKAVLSSRGKTYSYVVTIPDGASIYMTLDGTTPSKSNGDLVQGGIISVPAKKTAKLVCVKSGWKNSKVTTVKAGAASTSSSSSGKGTTSGGSSTAKPKNDSSSYASEVVRLVNEQRAAYGLSKLTTSTELTKVAQTRAKELSQSFSHTRPDGQSCFTALRDAGIDYMAAGENIASGYATPEEVVNGWMNSDGHRANILSSNFTMIGVGCDSRNWTQVFIG